MLVNVIIYACLFLSVQLRVVTVRHYGYVVLLSAS